jgi:N-acetylmuramoyl-L-alanine amidase
MKKVQSFKRNLFFVLLVLIITGCTSAPKLYQYSGTIDLSKHQHLDGKKIFIDPGHGALGFTDGRVGPTGLREEEVNLQVALILSAMCRTAGADVKLAREADIDVTLEERVKMAEEYKPDLFISIHHNSSSRPADKGYQYASILIWGNKDDNPASHDMGKLLLDEFGKVFGKECNLVSDYSVFRETGVKVLRETCGLCPGVLGEFGFFSDKTHEEKLKQEAYNVTEAECYFTALSEFFKRGTPDAVLLTDQYVGKPENQLGVQSRSPKFWIKIIPNTDKPDVYPGSLKVTINGLTVPTVRTAENMYRIEYGSSVYGGGTRIRFSFRNARQRSSMTLTSTYAVRFHEKEFDSNIANGSQLAENGDPRKALEMLLPTIFSGFTDPKGDTATYYAARAFDRLGDKPMASYYYTSLYQYYPESSLIKKIPSDYFKTRFVPTDFYGKRVMWERYRGR